MREWKLRLGQSGLPGRLEADENDPKDPAKTKTHGMSSRPSERVFRMLQQQQSDSRAVHPLFLEMEMLTYNASIGDSEWTEMARWVKYEEDVEYGGNRWSKPHVATLGLDSLFELRYMLGSGPILFDLKARDLSDIADAIVGEALEQRVIKAEDVDDLREVIHKRHCHQYEKKHKNHHHNGKASTGDFAHVPSSKSLADLIHATASIAQGFHKEDQDNKYVGNSHFMKKIPKDSEAATVLIGELSGLETVLSVFIRLDEGLVLGDLTEVPLPTRFIYLILYPQEENENRYREIGRAMSTMMVDETFGQVAYRAVDREQVMTGIDEFLENCIVLPPGEWDPSIRIDPPEKVSMKNREEIRLLIQRENELEAERKADEEKDPEKLREEAGLVKSLVPFSGLIKDVKKKMKWYLSDFKDALHLQCVASFFFMYFAIIAPTIAFGGLLSETTGNQIGVIESMVGSCVVGVVFALFSGQPLSILGPTGPIVLFEGLVYRVATENELNFLPFRLWVGLFMGLFLLLLVAFNMSYLVIFITRFTEELFATFIAAIFIFNAFKKIYKVSVDYPMFPTNCTCSDGNLTSTEFIEDGKTSERLWNCHFTDPNDTSIEIMGEESLGCHYVPNVLMTSVVLFAGTYLIAKNLKQFRTARFPNRIRTFVSDFAVFLALAAMTLLDYFVGVATPKLQVPQKFETSVPGRPWILPLFDGNPGWSVGLALGLSALGVILVFMDHQITQVIVNRKENQLKKGCGYHLDLLVVTVMVVVCSVFGFPWCEASTVPAINHVKSLIKESKEAAPGEKPKFLGIREQRVTAFVVFLALGLSAFAAPVLSLIPLPVLFGVFLYMGVTSLNGLQFFERICLFPLPPKYQPDYMYLRKVPYKDVKMFTVIQLLCFGLLLLVNYIHPIVQMALPITLVVLVLVRKYLLEHLFDGRQLSILDDALPSGGERKKNKKTAAALGIRYTEDGMLEVPLPNGDLLKIPMTEQEGKMQLRQRNSKHAGAIQKSSSCASIDISDVIRSSGLWESCDTRQKSQLKQHQHELDGAAAVKNLGYVLEGDEGEEASSDADGGLQMATRKAE